MTDPWKQLCPEPHQEPEAIEGGNGFFPSDDRMRFIESGSVNLFIGSFDITTGHPAGPYQYVAGLEAGDVLFPLAFQLEKEQVVYRLLAIPLPGSVLRQSRGSWLEPAQRDELVQRQFEQFVTQLLRPFAQEMPPAKTQVITWSDLEKTRSFSYQENTSFRPGQGLLWVQLDEGFCILNSDEEQLLLTPGASFPMTPQMWFQTMDPVVISCRTTADCVANVNAAERYEQVFQLNYLRAVLVAVIYRKQRLRQRRQQLVIHEQSALQNTMERMRNLLRSQPAAKWSRGASVSQLRAVLLRIAQVNGTELVLPDALPDCPDTASILHLLEQCNLFYRIIKLTGNWWRIEGGPAIAFRKADHRPLALFFEQGNYQLFDPEQQITVPLTKANAADLKAQCISIYARLPARKLQLRDILQIAFLGLRPDLRATFIIGLIGGLIAMVPARVTSTLFNNIIPTAEYFQLFQMGVILLSAAITAALFELSRSILMLRVKTRSNYQLQSAVWGRLLNLKVAFFGRYSVGDLAQRVMGIDSIRAMLTDNVSMAAMSLVFALPNLILMLYYSGLLTLVGLLAILGYIIALMGISFINYKNQREEYKRDGELSGFVLQAISGIAKIRMSISEHRVFVRWANLFAEKIHWKKRSINNSNLLTVLGTAFSPIITGLFFLIIGSKWKETSLNTGDYLAFNAAFSSLSTAFVGFAAILPAFLASIALYKRMQPILDEVPEIDDTQKSAELVDGNVELRNVTYRYSPDVPPVLKGVSLTASSGEFIAVVGPSGAGKSTIARLLLGFDSPESGGIYFGGMDMASVNRRDLRKQIGTVLQSGGLIQASIYENIAGASGMTLDEAWEAARLAGCDDDIRAMPMGMHTLVQNGVVSGGQRQRLLIARALARNPRVILFDEATSALDNETQAHVSDSLDRLNATRIVIAHRLSTIMHADRIYVLDSGKIVQTGTFSELINQPGMFQRLAQRQML